MDEATQTLSRRGSLRTVREREPKPIEGRESCTLLTADGPIRTAADLVGRKRRPLTLQEIADVFGISKERARQIEMRALEKLRRRGVLRADWRDLAG